MGIGSYGMEMWGGPAICQPWTKKASGVINLSPEDLRNQDSRWWKPVETKDRAANRGPLV